MSTMVALCFLFMYFLYAILAKVPQVGYHAMKSDR